MRKLNLIPPPQSICILRLSAIGDTCHVVPVVRTLQRVWPSTRLSWIIGRTEAQLMSLLPEVEFIIIDKRSGWRSFRTVRKQLRARRFDLLLHMQLALRASLISTSVHAPVRLGFDRARARELQWLFTNARIEPRSNQHVLDSFQGFLGALGIEGQALEWNLPLPPEAQQYAQQLVPDTQPTLLISPCSSHAARDWRADRYAAIATHAVKSHGMRVILCGGRSEHEHLMGAQIERLCEAGLVNQIGRDTLPQLLALIARSTVLLSPDAGPVHMATMVGTPVIGLYACTRSARSGPYHSREWCIDHYELAAQRFRGRSGAQLPWQEKIEQPGVMDLIEVAEVRERLDAFMRYHRAA